MQPNDIMLLCYCDIFFNKIYTFKKSKVTEKLMEVPERDKSIRFGLEKLYEFPFQGKRVYSFCKISKWEYLVASQTGLQLFKDGNMVENFPIYLTFVQYIPELDIILGVSTSVPYLVFISNRKKKLQSPVKFRLTISLVKQAEYSVSYTHLTLPTTERV